MLIDNVYIVRDASKYLTIDTYLIILGSLVFKILNMTYSDGRTGGHLGGYLGGHLEFWILKPWNDDFIVKYELIALQYPTKGHPRHQNHCSR